jgi:hypothetical protein
MEGLGTEGKGGGRRRGRGWRVVSMEEQWDVIEIHRAAYSINHQST